MDQEDGSRQAGNPKVIKLIRVAQDLDRLLAQRAEITQRIEVARQMLAGLAGEFGAVAAAEVAGWAPRRTTRQPGFTHACRTVLLEASGALTGREVQEQLRMKFPEIAGRHKDLGASVGTVLSRLVAYGEAQTAGDAANQKAWWSAVKRQPVGGAGVGNEASLPAAPALATGDNGLDHYTGHGVR